MDDTLYGLFFSTDCNTVSFYYYSYYGTLQYSFAVSDLGTATQAMLPYYN